MILQIVKRAYMNIYALLEATAILYHYLMCPWDGCENS